MTTTKRKPITQLKKSEQMIFDLRAMYAQYGYTQFKIRKFEEFELYVRNKDFLDSVNVITFTDTNGKLMALKPDVTLSVVKNSKDVPGTVQKVYYNENIYRVSRRSHMFEELMQVGIECIGDIDDYNIFEVLMLALKTLRSISPKSILDLSNLDIVSAILSDYHVSDATRTRMLRCLGEKNIHTLRRICQENDVSPGGIEVLEKLTRISLPISKDRAQASYEQHGHLLEAIRDRDAERAQTLMTEHNRDILASIKAYQYQNIHLFK